ncbi:hypothetical protein DYD21_06570 [Rhodohalobacter sp. SW132]|uniref:hypothetical protein n=1 Tax=Rhodohalobacter sp. SW132 TaxID=2293433 RepID=UPI000E256B83|nr:hypothetical protein [Rhodohalobacter sp. SW132]REL38265.1 hypothetical protein DYD21_06570 [Rhodohalobacter sp. SW132]
MKHSLHFSLGAVLLLVFVISSCDEISTTPESGSLSVQSFSISPNNVQFDEETPIGVVSLPVSLQLTLNEPTDQEIRYTFENRGNLVEEGTFNSESETEYIAELSLAVNSVENVTYKVYAFSNSGDRMQGSINFIGRMVSPPEIADAYNTEEAVIPNAGNEQIDFFAEVSHPDGQEYIDGVFFILIDQQGNQLGNDFEMYDDGVQIEDEGRIDETADDGLYSRAFFINPSNNPDEYSVFYYAMGADGQSSDTLQTQLRIVE